MEELALFWESPYLGNKNQLSLMKTSCGVLEQQTPRSREMGAKLFCRSESWKSSRIQTRVPSGISDKSREHAHSTCPEVCLYLVDVLASFCFHICIHRVSYLGVLYVRESDISSDISSSYSISPHLLAVACICVYAYIFISCYLVLLFFLIYTFPNSSASLQASRVQYLTFLIFTSSVLSTIHWHVAGI